MAELTDTREAVRERYAAAARAVTEDKNGAGCCGSAEGCGSSTLRAEETDVFGEQLYQADERAGATDTAVSASMGCGVPTAVADLREGETVLDLGSGAGADVLISARRVGPTGKAIGVDMTDEMLDLARRSASEAGADNVRVRQRHHRGAAAARLVGRRGDLQLRDQPLRRQGHRCCARPPGCCAPAGASPFPT